MNTPEVIMTEIDATNLYVLGQSEGGVGGGLLNGKPALFLARSSDLPVGYTNTDVIQNGIVIVLNDLKGLERLDDALLFACETADSFEELLEGQCACEAKEAEDAAAQAEVEGTEKLIHQLLEENAGHRAEIEDLRQKLAAVHAIAA